MDEFIARENVRRLRSSSDGPQKSAIRELLGAEHRRLENILRRKSAD